MKKKSLLEKVRDSKRLVETKCPDWGRWAVGRTKTVHVAGSEMPEHAVVKVEMGADEGNSTRTALEFSWDGGGTPSITYRGLEESPKDSPEVEISSFRLVLVGEWEREGMARAMILAGMELLKGP